MITLRGTRGLKGVFVQIQLRIVGGYLALGNLLHLGWIQRREDELRGYESRKFQLRSLQRLVRS